MSASVWLALLAASTVTTPAGPNDEDHLVAKGERAGVLAEAVEGSASLGFSGAVLVARDGKVLVALGAGSADLEGEVPNTANTLFELASATKQFTGAAVCELAERRKLKLDDSIAEHLPGVPEECAGITLRHLLQHTSGIPRTNSRGAGEDLAAVVPVFLAGGPQHEPGTRFEYWNQGYALLAGVIEQASGDGYAEFCRDELFGRAKMRSSCFTGDEAPSRSIVAVGRSSSGAPRTALDHPYGSYGYQYRGMGGAVSNVWDLWRWDRALKGTKVLKQASKDELFRPGPASYALGWYVRESGGRTVQSHGGSVRGFTCEVRRYPGDDGCLFVLANRDDAPARQLANLLEAILFDGEFALPPRPVEQELQAALVGEYTSESGALLVLEADGAATRARIEWGGVPGEGPTTRAYLGGIGEGALVLYEWTRTTPVDAQRGADGLVQIVRVGLQEYAR